MKHKWLALLLMAPVLIMADERPAFVCRLPLMKSPRQEQQAAVHALSVAAEAVGATRHRAVAPPGNPSAGIAFPPAANFIDTDLFAAMKTNNVAPTQLAGDEDFLRRVTLDLTGQIPDSSTVQAFLADTSADKRANKIDQLLASDAFADRWTMWFGDLVQNVQTSANSREYYLGRNLYYTFIHDSLKNGKPYDQMVREVISAKGGSFATGPANYWVC